MARGANHWRRGWHERDAKYASETRREQFTAMSASFAVARQDLNAAIGINPKLTGAYALLISIAMAEGQEAEIALTTYAGLKEVPESFFVREKFLYSKTPWWGGATVTNIDVYYSRMSDEILQHSNLRPLAGYGDYVGGFVQSLEKKLYGGNRLLRSSHSSWRILAIFRTARLGPLPKRRPRRGNRGLRSGHRFATSRA